MLAPTLHRRCYAWLTKVIVFMFTELPFFEVVSNSKNSMSPVNTQGKVSLVGAGPGDPDLLTVKALRIIQQADLILFDRLVSAEIRALFPVSTPAIYVGKAKDRHSISQAQLNTLLLDKVRLGLNVCRIKGGDPLIFGRGSEEMLSLKAQGVDVEVVPGITAASGCTSYAGIPLTHRGISQGCTFFTAHAEEKLEINWSALANFDHTLVFYMGLSKASMISDELIQAGLKFTTPIAFIENGCCPQQRLITGELHDMAALVKRADIQSPTLIVVGETVLLADRLRWFQKLSVEDVQQLSA